MFGLFTSIVAFDHLKHQLLIISNIILDPAHGLRGQYDNALSEIESIERRILSPNGAAHPFTPAAGGPTNEMSRERFEALVRTAKDHIVEGDIFQVVVSQRFSQKYEGDSFNVYRALRIINPSPYLYYLNFPGSQVIGSSPEILVRMDGETAEVYPIAGTRPRGASAEEDAANERDLLRDEKERAEHVMLVDLGRNDLGRVCELGSVLVDEFMFPVRYSHVMHIASRVTGVVAPALGCLDVLKAVFPAGTVSGAPKIRAMEIIDALEPSRRCVYAGGVGYLDFAGRMDFCIAIRTLFAKDGVLHYQAGAGIVADSDPSREYQETLVKAGALKDAIALAERIR
jgi:anthranilate synthase component 1